MDKDFYEDGYYDKNNQEYIRDSIVSIPFAGKVQEALYHECRRNDQEGELLDSELIFLYGRYCIMIISPNNRSAEYWNIMKDISIVEKPLEYTLGDVNNDGKVDDGDVIFLMRHIAAWKQKGYFNLFAADIDKDGQISDADCIHLARHIAGWDIPYFD